jgi:hypothetical protein
MPKWTVVVVVTDGDTEQKCKVEHEIERSDQMAAIEAALGRQLPCHVLPEDQVMFYAERLEEEERPEVIIESELRPLRNPAHPYSREPRGKQTGEEPKTS